MKSIACSTHLSQSAIHLTAQKFEKNIYILGKLHTMLYDGSTQFNQQEKYFVNIS
jgi:hypothetical protein